MNSTTKRLAQLHFFVQNDPWLAICTVAQCLTRSSRNRSLVASVCLLTSLAAGLEMGLDGVCVKTFFSPLAQGHICYIMRRYSLAPAHQHDVGVIVTFGSWHGLFTTL